MGKEYSLLITGGAGFIGSNLVNKYIHDPRVSLVRVVDDLSNGYYSRPIYAIMKYVLRSQRELIKLLIRPLWAQCPDR